MQATKDSVVSFHYTLFNNAGEELETSRDGDPTLFLFGHNGVLPGVESALEDKSVGEQLSVELAAKDAFGLQNTENKQRIPSKYLKHEGKMRPGQIIRINTEEGVKTGTVIKVGKFNIDVDMNHPLAGQDVRFDIEIVEIRQATEDEVSHGHAHGAGGHQH